MPTQKEPEEYPPIGRYQVNVLVDHSKSEGAPVIFEEYPTYNNLVGRIEQLVAGAGRMYCGACMRENRLAAKLRQQGREINVPIPNGRLSRESMEGIRDAAMMAITR